MMLCSQWSGYDVETNNSYYALKFCVQVFCKLFYLQCNAMFMLYQHAIHLWFCVQVFVSFICNAIANN